MEKCCYAKNGLLYCHLDALNDEIAYVTIQIQKGGWVGYRLVHLLQLTVITVRRSCCCTYI